MKQTYILGIFVIIRDTALYYVKYFTLLYHPLAEIVLYINILYVKREKNINII